MKTEKKIKKLEKIIREMGSVVTAFSGGVDSTFLSKVCRDILGKEKMLAVTACSSTYPSSESKEAEKNAKYLDIPWLSIISEELDIPNFSENPPDRCYYCKHELFQKLKQIAGQKGFNAVLDGTNYDDRNDFRPGIKALNELGIISPLKLARITKEEIRTLSREMNIPTWNKPSFACLASRFPYGEKITAEKLVRLDKIESFLKKLDLKQLRVRIHGSIARLELNPADFPKIIKQRVTIIKKIKKLGFHYVTLDMEGYRTGSMNEPLNKKIKRGIQKNGKK